MRYGFASLCLILPTLGFAQNDTDYGKKIKEYTTESFFLPDLVDHLPASKSVPSPEKFLGHIVGAPNVLTYSKAAADYLRLLEKASRRVKVVSMGLSEEGREMVVAIISDAANLRKLDQYKQINATLGDPRQLKGAQDAENLIKQGLPMYWATGGMHAPETGPPEMIMELAYRLAVSEEPFIQNIRKNEIVMLTPVLDVDGRDRVVDLYRYRKDNPTKPPIPLAYWGHYVAHDDNRDALTMALNLSKSLMKTWLDFKPTVLHDLHESVPYLYISTGTGPYNAWLDPIVISEWQDMAYNEIQQMTEKGVPGVWTHNYYDGWAPSYGFYVANGHNGIGRFYETFGGGGADTGIRTAGETTREWYRPNPPFPRVRWSIRNNVNVMQSALLMGMSKVATEKEKFLRNYYLKASRSIAKATTEGPAAWVIEPKPLANAAQLADIMAQQGVEVKTLDQEVTTADGKFAKGSLVIRMDQPYSRMADMMLDKQYYNPTDPRSYDDTGWELGALFGLKTVRVKDIKVLTAKMAGYTSTDHGLSTPPGLTNKKIALVHTWTSTQDEGWARIAFDQRKIPYSYVSVHELRDTPNLRARYDVIVIPNTGGTAQSIVNGMPMVGDPIAWKATQKYPNIGAPDATDDMRGGIELKGMLNVQKFLNEGGLLICIGNACRVPIDYGIVSGVSVFTPTGLNAPGGVYHVDRADETSPVLSGYGDSMDTYFNMNSMPILAGGVAGGGRGGARGGGALGGATRPSGRGSLTDPDVVQGRLPYTPKTLPGDTTEVGRSGPRLPSPSVLLRFADTGKVLVSGMIDHPEELAGKSALVDCPVGKGHVLLFGINPFWRGETVGSYNLVFNAIRNSEKLSPNPAK